MQSVTKVNGLYTYPSEVNKIPEGALFEADDVVIDRDSVLEVRPGFDNLSAISATSSDRSKQIIPFKNKLIVHYGTTLAQNNSGSFSAYSGSYSEPNHNDSYVPKIKAQEANSNLYFTTSDGVKKLDSITGTIVAAGSPQGLDMTLALSGASGFMSNNTQVAYRVVWGYKDANNNLILGAPGQRTIIVNSAGATRDVSVTFTIPQGVTTSYFYQVYRSGMSIDVNTEPNDELGLVYESNPTAGEITATSVTFVDSTPDSLRGATIYTASSQEGILQSNDRPPAAKDIAYFKNCVFLSNTKTVQRLYITMLSAYGNSGVNYRTFTADTHTNTTVDNVASVTGVAIGQSITGSGFQAGTTITNITGAGPYTLTISLATTSTLVGTTVECFDVITINSVAYKAAAAEDVANNKFQVFTTGTSSQNIQNTAQSLVKIINRSASNTALDAFYVSSFDELPGKILLSARALSTASFAAIASSHGTAWNPSLPTSGTTVSSSNDAFKNALFISKPLQPEAFPLTQYLRIGAADQPIHRIIPLRESLIVLKTDGVYRITGEEPRSFVVDLLDSTVVLLAPETASRLNNQVYALTNQGIATISDTGVGIISRPIENKILELQNYTNYITASFATSFETGRKYILAVPSSDDDTYATQEFVYNTFTNTWVRWRKNWTCGAINPADDKMYFGSGTDFYLKIQRRAGDYTDASDESASRSITSVSGATLGMSSLTGLTVGDAIVQGSLPFSLITAIDTNTTSVTVDVERAFTVAACTVYFHIDSNVKWAPQYQGNPGNLKQTRECILLTKDSRFSSASLKFSSNLVRTAETVPIDGFRSGLWGYGAWGEFPWGGENNPDKIRTYVPATSQYNEWLNISFLHSNCFGMFGIEGFVLTFNSLSERVGR